MESTRLESLLLQPCERRSYISVHCRCKLRRRSLRACLAFSPHEPPGRNPHLVNYRRRCVTQRAQLHFWCRIQAGSVRKSQCNRLWWQTYDIPRLGTTSSHIEKSLCSIAALKSHHWIELLPVDSNLHLGLY